MLSIKELMLKAKDTLSNDAYEKFVLNTIKTCGYNSNTYDLFKKLDGNINVNKYKNSLVNDLKTCAKENLKEKEEVEKITFKENLNDLKKSLNGIISNEEIDTILFDNNVKMVDDYIDYNRINGNNVLDNVDMYLDTFKTGVNSIDNEPDYSFIKEDIYSDVGLSLNGLENLENDVSIEGDINFEEEKENSIDIDLNRGI